jgi:3-oxoacyl-[acyl-carrier-protein] synthase III
MTMESATREINRLFGGTICHNGNIIKNLEQRGNTASNSHFVALADHIYNERVQSDDKIIFTISASGLTVGTALYVFDDLPDRLRQTKSNGVDFTKRSFSESVGFISKSSAPKVRVESVGLISEGFGGEKHSMKLLLKASKNCMSQTAYQPNEIGMLMYCGVYRSEYVLEPAYAALLAGDLNLNAANSEPSTTQTFAFDVFNGAVGFLNACYLSQQMIASGSCKASMVVAAETENNAEHFSQELLGVRETASTVILDADPSNQKGFSQFYFACHEEALDAYTTYTDFEQINPYLRIHKDPNLEDLYLKYIKSSVLDFLKKAGKDLADIDVIFPPQISATFIGKLSDSLNLIREKLVNVVGEGPDLFTSSIPYALEHAYENKLVRKGDLGLMIAVGSGIQVGCAFYHF